MFFPSFSYFWKLACGLFQMQSAPSKFSFRLIPVFFLTSIELEESIPTHRYLQLDELSIKEVVWVDEMNSLLDATFDIEECKVVGVDCEWKPNYEKGCPPNKVLVG